MFELNDCEIKYGYDNMNFEKVTAMLSHAFWCEGIQFSEVTQGAKNSALVTGVFFDGEQISYARVISDKTRFAYILDVYVDEPFRKKGIGQLMIKSILVHEELKDVYQWLLITRDAHDVYKKCGFRPIEKPDLWMGIMNARSKR